MSGSSQNTIGHKDTVSKGVSETIPTGIRQYQDQFTTGYNDIYGQYQGLQPVDLQSAPLYSNTLDPIVQNAISKGIQGIKANQATQGQQTASALNVAGGGNNAALINVLNRQAGIAGAGAANQLYGTGLEQQRSQDVARQAMISDINKVALAKRQTEIGQLGSQAQLLQALVQMAAVARGEKKTYKGSEITDYNEQINKGK